MKLKMKNISKITHILIAGLILVSCNTKKETPEGPKLLLPVIGEKKYMGMGTDTIYHTVGDFKLINQNKDTVSQKTTENKIYVADFFFATCQSICPQMSHELIRVQDAFKNDN